MSNSLRQDILTLLSQASDQLDVNNQMLMLKEHLLLDKKNYEKRLDIVLKISHTMKKNFPKSETNLFGSTLNGLGSKYCDLDLYLDLTKEKSLENMTNREIGEKIYLALETNPNMIKVQSILNARVPIVRFVDKSSGITGDLSFTTQMAVMNTRFLQLCQKVDPRITTLMTTIKFWAEFHDVSGSGNGRNRWYKMSSYALNLLVVFYLQQEKFLPSIKELHYNTFGEDSCIIDDLECGFPHDISKWKILSVFSMKNCRNEKDLSQLLHGFFEFYTNFDYENYIISPYEGHVVKKEPDGGMKMFKDGDSRMSVLKEGHYLKDCKGSLVIQDPFQLDFCVTDAYNSNDWKDMCEITHQIISNWHSAKPANLLDIFDKIQRLKNSIRQCKKSRGKAKRTTNAKFKILNEYEELKTRAEKILNEWEKIQAMTAKSSS